MSLNLYEITTKDGKEYFLDTDIKSVMATFLIRCDNKIEIERFPCGINWEAVKKIVAQIEPGEIYNPIVLERWAIENGFTKDEKEKGEITK